MPDLRAFNQANDLLTEHEGCHHDSPCCMIENDANRRRGNSDGASGRRRIFFAARGFTLIEMMIVVALVGLLAAIALPNFLRARRAANVRFCITNLRRLEDSKGQWALEYKKTDTVVPTTADITPYLKNGQMPRCPASGTYRLRRVSRIPTCSLTSIGHTLNNLNMDDDPFAD